MNFSLRPLQGVSPRDRWLVPRWQFNVNVNVMRSSRRVGLGRVLSRALFPCTLGENVNTTSHLR